MAANGVGDNIFVGVDSGGTRTNVRVSAGNRLNDSLKTLASYEIAESLSGALHPEYLSVVLRKILAPLDRELEQYSDWPVYIFVSAAGFSPVTRAQYLATLEDARSTVLGSNVRGIGAANDGVVTLLGFEANAIVIAGTGSVVLLHDTQGQIHQAGGQEWVACDQGAGFWIGLRAIREAYRDFEDGRESVLLQRLRQEFGVRSDEPKALKAKLRQLAVADKEMKKEIARFAFLVCGAAERGDASSQNIIKDEAESLADMTAGGLRRTFTRDELIKGVRIVQVGSLLGNEFYRLAFEAQVQRRLLAGVKQQAVLNWHRVATAVEATLCLAQRLANDSESMLNIDPEFRPIILSSE